MHRSILENEVRLEHATGRLGSRKPSDTCSLRSCAPRTRNRGEAGGSAEQAAPTGGHLSESVQEWAAAAIGQKWPAAGG